VLPRHSARGGGPPPCPHLGHIPRLQPEAADLLKGYKAGLDITVFAFYKELMVLHPRAKVLLTVREARGWYRSMLTLRRVFLTLYQQPYRAVLRAMGIGHFATFTAFSWSVETPGIIGRMNRAVEGGEEQAIARPWPRCWRRCPPPSCWCST